MKETLCLWPAVAVTVRLLVLFPADCTGRMLPGPILRRTLAGLRSEPLRVVPVQRAGELPVWLLRGPVSHQYGEAQRGTPAAQFPLRL